jgi:hypothetical protein
MKLRWRQDTEEPRVFIYDAVGEYEGAWVSGPVECVQGCRRWYAVRPVGHDGGLECPDCGGLTGFALLDEGLREVEVSLQ